MLPAAERISDLVFPSFCLACGERLSGNAVLCQDCFDRIPTATSIVCGRCRSRLPMQKKTCHKDYPYLLATAGSYRNEATRNLLHTLKFEGRAIAAEPIIEFIFRFLSASGVDLRGFTLVPVPLHAQREKNRGFNQSELIARGLAAKFSLPIGSSILRRTRKTKPQSELRGREVRDHNVMGAFIASFSAPPISKIALVDDVVTSGATLFESARALRAAGAKRVIAIVAAAA